ncbi:hypothetical protein QZH56_00005 [Streptomyces olivoreticuli]|uniref:hypothetical protein n=1 Tax=Streptomyces olivoreticuli TaxID=68246 RepID=UPI00265875D8|nr:hypothetical protein [Streptomyces olivoreticuli]WKK24149.1 hypothetical protein QZH56_00005 [Streptomyces olivoreticuli]
MHGTAESVHVGGADGAQRVRRPTGASCGPTRSSSARACTAPAYRTFAAFEGHPHYLDSPYPADRIRRLPPDSRVLVLGSHLSAVDAALLLCRDGHRTTLTSPSGLLPPARVSLSMAVRDFPPLERISLLDPDDPLLEERLTRCVVESVRLLDRRPLRLQTSRAADPVRRLREETKLVEEGACSWADVMVPLIETVIALAPSLRPARRRALMARFSWFTGRYATAMTVVNARRLLACFESGALRMADSYPLGVSFAQGAWRIERPDGHVDCFDYVVNATGYHPPVLHWDREGSALHLGDPPARATAVDHLEGTSGCAGGRGGAGAGLGGGGGDPRPHPVRQSPAQCGAAGTAGRAGAVGRGDPRMSRGAIPAAPAASPRRRRRPGRTPRASRTAAGCGS